VSSEVFERGDTQLWPAVSGDRVVGTKLGGDRDRPGGLIAIYCAWAVVVLVQALT